MKRHIRFILKLVKLSARYNILRSLAWNIRLFPFRDAVGMPLLLGYGIRFCGDVRRNVIISSKVPLGFGSIRLGVTNYPMMPSKKGGFIRLSRDARLILNGRIRICDGFGISIPLGGKIEIGDDCFINQNVVLYAGDSIEIGNHCRIGWNAQIIDSDCHLVYDSMNGVIGNPVGRIKIGNNVWIASCVTVRKGAVLPNYSIVAGNSLVNKDFGAIDTKGNVFVGAPARLVATERYRLLNERLESTVKKLGAQLPRVLPMKFDLEVFERLLTKYPDSDIGIGESISTIEHLVIDSRNDMKHKG